MSSRPSVLFVCVHNAGRSQMAAAFLTHLAGEKVEVRSAGSEPVSSINPVVAAAMLEVGIDISREVPKVLTTEGCGDACPFFPGKRYLDWKLADPAAANLADTRTIRDEIRGLVVNLITDLEREGRIFVGN
jgi:arsenate reductase